MGSAAQNVDASLHWVCKGILLAMRPLIGIPLCLDDRGRWRESRDYLYIDDAYAKAVTDAGGAVIHPPIQADPEELVYRIDGLLLPGGDDLPPPDAARYSDVHFDLAPRAQVDFDRRLLRAALDRGIPVFCICYGMQLLALEFGGSLHYDIPHDVPGADSHRLPEAEGRRDLHDLHLQPGTRLAALLGEAPGAVNSLHHQAVADPGDRLRVAARAGDGLIEAVELDSDLGDAGFCLGVQWHPEKMRGPKRNLLFSAFVAACAAAQELVENK